MLTQLGRGWGVRQSPWWKVRQTQQGPWCCPWNLSPETRGIFFPERTTEGRELKGQHVTAGTLAAVQQGGACLLERV